MEQFTIDDWVVVPGRNVITRNGSEKRLEPRVMDLLIYLARRAGEVVSHDDIIANVWPHAFVTDSALHTAISALRRAFGDDPRRPRLLQTVPKRGYRLIAESSASTPTLAVLPFKNLTGASEHDYLVDGITDTLIAALGPVPAVNVISRHSTMSFRDRHLLLPKIAAELNADYVVDGSALIRGDGFQLTVQVVNAVRDTHVWSGSYTASRERLFDLQRPVARDILTAVGKEGGFDSEDRDRQDVAPAAVTHYLRGRFHWYKFEPQHFPLALEHFEQAVALAPAFGAAHAGIADVWGALGYWGLRPAAEVAPKVRAALDRAARVDPRSAEVSMLYGAYHFYSRYEWQAAERSLREAVRLNPNLAHARLLLALLHATLGRPGALEQADRALALDPLNVAIMLARALCLFGEGRHADARVEIESILEMAPRFAPALELGAELAWTREEAYASERERRVWAHDDEMAACFPDSAGVDGLRAAAERLQRRRKNGHVAARSIARLYSLAGDVDRALDVLEAAVSDSDLMQIDFVQLAPAFANVRQQPRYAKLVASIGLPPAALDR